MDLEEVRLEGKLIYQPGMSACAWFDAVEQKCGCGKPHQIIAVAPFPYVVLTQHTLQIHGNDIMLSLFEKIMAGQCVRVMDRYFFFTDEVDAVIFKLLWTRST